MHPSIDHTILSPSGRVSKRARAAALARETARLFPPGTFGDGRPKQCERTQDLRYAAFLRELAERGVGPRKHRKEAARLEAKWANVPE